MSLLELVIVMFILSAILMVAMPRFAGLRNGLSTEASRVASVLRYVSDAAAAHKARRAVKFKFADHTMAYDQDGTLRTYELDDLSSVELLSRGNVKDGELVVVFSPEGLGEDMTVHLKKDNKELDVEYNPISRRVSIQTPEEQKEQLKEEKNPYDDENATDAQ